VNGKISETEFPEETVLMTARPELEKIPRSQNYVGFRGVDRNHDSFLDATEWETYRTRVSEMMKDHGLLAIRPDGDKAEVIWSEKTSVPEIPSPLFIPGPSVPDSKRRCDDVSHCRDGQDRLSRACRRAGSILRVAG
jgi:hypothetical protein